MGKKSTEIQEMENSEKRGKKEKKPKKRRKGLLFLIIVLIVVIAALGLWKGLGLGAGSGGGSGSGDSSPSDSEVVSTSEDSGGVSVIRIAENDIYLNDVKLADTAELKEKITVAGNGKSYKLVHDTAIKDTYDKVKDVLSEVQDALKLEIDYNE